VKKQAKKQRKSKKSRQRKTKGWKNRFSSKKCQELRRRVFLVSVLCDGFILLFTTRSSNELYWLCDRII